MRKAVPLLDIYASSDKLTILKTVCRRILVKVDNEKIFTIPLLSSLYPQSSSH